MAYNSPYQPQMDRQQFQKMGMSAGKNILEQTIIYGTQALKFVIQFTFDAIKQILGK